MKEKIKEYKNISEKEDNSTKPSLSKDSSFFLVREVEKSGHKGIEKTFEALLLERGLSWSQAYNSEELRFDKSYASKVRRGIIIPPLWQQIKIARFFKIDSTVIWNSKNMEEEDDTTN